MSITGGFGTRIDLENGTSRKWVMSRDGVKRWADSGQAITQELPNAELTGTESQKKEQET